MNTMSSPAVLLINPSVRSPSSTRLPLSLLNLGAVMGDRWPWRIVDGNVETDAVAVAKAALRERPHALIAVTVMTGPQVIAAVEISSALRAAFPSIPIVWGGYFPTLYSNAAINAHYVDYLVRGQGENTLLELLERLPEAGPPSISDSARDPSVLKDIAGLTWKSGGVPIHNPDRPVVPPETFPLLPYDRVDVASYLRPSFMGARTAVYQSALGCRYRCSFCGVVSMWNGKTVLEVPERMRHSLAMLRDRWGADCMMFYDHNFFDREETSLPVLEALGTLDMPYWCFARTDTLARFPASTWEKIRKSRLRMAFFGAEAATDEALNKMRKGAKVDHTLEVARRCREYGVVPELSFILGGPDDPEDQIETTFRFIRRVKELNPDSEIILHFYTPTPQVDRKSMRSQPNAAHLPVMDSYGPSGPALPTTPEGWAQQKWVSWICHEDAPWLTPKIRQRVKDFARVIACRFPTIQDYRQSAVRKAVLRNLARARYATRYYNHSWELALAQRLIRLRDPRTQSL
jgi:radical SAM superfamily enzyme YgiQ (UPF0313 family)